MDLIASRLDAHQRQPDDGDHRQGARAQGGRQGYHQPFCRRAGLRYARNVKSAAIRAIEAGETKYTDVSGTPALKRAVADKFRRDSGLDYAPEEIIVSTGGKQVIFNAMLATIDAGDEVVIPAPCWVSYPDIVALAEGTPVIVPCGQNNGFKLRAEDLEAAITPRTKWFFINSPCNPTGAAYSADEAAADLRRAAEASRCVDLHRRHLREAELRRLPLRDHRRSRAAPARTHRHHERLQQGLRHDRLAHRLRRCAREARGGDGQAAGAVHLQPVLDRAGGRGRGAERTAGLGRRHGARLRAAPRSRGRHAERDAGPDLRTPEGAFYVFPSVHGCIGKTSRGGAKITDDESFVTALMAEQGVATVHGPAFMSPGYFRVSYATSTENLREACTRIRRFCEGLA